MFATSMRQPSRSNGGESHLRTTSAMRVRKSGERQSSLGSAGTPSQDA
jgi:hypothetical protein